MLFEVGVNTYMTVEEADSIMQDEFESTEAERVIWDALDDAGKKRVILKGTRVINTLVWRGTRYPGFQSMPWPRLIQFNYVECPYEVKLAILKQSLKDRINDEKQETKLQELGVKSYSIKGASITFTDSSKQVKLSNGIYDTIYTELLERWTA